MKAYLYHFIILLAVAGVFLPTAAVAQKIKKTQAKTETKTESKNENKPVVPAQIKTESKTASEKVNLSTLEAAVVEEINQARNDPQKFIAYLEEYKKYMSGTILSLPNKTRLQMIEGLPAIEDAINDLKKVGKISSFQVSGGLTKVARQQLSDLQENPKLKHLGKDGSDLPARLLKVGFAGEDIAENISYRVDTPREIVMNMIIDDGYKSRAHRKNIFSTRFKLFGIACGLGQDKKTLCVAEFANSFDER